MKRLVKISFKVFSTLKSCHKMLKISNITLQYYKVVFQTILKILKLFITAVAARQSLDFDIYLSLKF